ncbi:hypothetical protein [Spiroplasma floricola]|uniref:Uncharacterized protein n=1 Tax=Spiroplasma floricola 23-6 TaxID=1336749 RepID=A0A2K8SE85_9MOLU|nr:hypothetical protein [Spiroplasma floricola]AUB31733.1 hypothetical protein SFLOR_v1c06850 [Spiroplasma floricola 23-6]
MKNRNEEKFFFDRKFPDLLEENYLTIRKEDGVVKILTDHIVSVNIKSQTQVFIKLTNNEEYKLDEKLSKKVANGLGFFD